VAEVVKKTAQLVPKMTSTPAAVVEAVKKTVP
jgi:hypothetical protein